jgi:PIN domain nuclease of toxin-antitoxin system
VTDVLDAFALVALIRDEPAAPEVEAILRRGAAAITTTNLGEALDQLHRVDGVSLASLRELLSPTLDEIVRVIDHDAALTWRAVELRARHYRRRGSELSLADCVVLAAARGSDRIVTADPPLVRAARAEGLDVVALPGSGGRQPA